MKREYTFFGVLLCGQLLASSTAFAAAPVNVSSCSAHRNVSTSGGGYVPGYYPAGRYYYRSAYGFNYYQPPVTTSSPTLNIDYTNTGTQPMKDIEFGLVTNGNLIAEVKDVGTFSPGAEIKHKFGVHGSIFPLQGIPRCVPLKITYADGTKWTSPHLPALKHQLGDQ